MKRITSVCLIFFIGLFIFSGMALAAPTTSPTATPTKTPADDSKGPTYDGYNNDNSSVMLVDADSGRVLFHQKEDDQVKPASTTKIMTTILALENSSLDDVVTVPSKADFSSATYKNYSKLGIKANEKITMKDLVYGMMVVSGDDAAIAIANYIGSKKDADNPVDTFVGMMNDKAKELGMNSTQFKNPGGTEDPDHYVTASDMAKLAVYAMKNETFREIVKLTSYDMAATNKNPVRTKDTTNSLLESDSPYYYQYATGIKTGATTAAGGTLVASATKNGMNLICLIFNDQISDRNDRFKIAKGLFDWGFDNFETVKLSSILSKVDTKTDSLQVQVDNFSADDLGSGVLQFDAPNTDDTFVTLSKTTAEGLTNGTDTIEANKKLKSDKIEAPVAKGDLIGTVTYTSKATGEELFKENLLAPRDVLQTGTSATNGQTAVATLPPTPPAKVVTQSDNSLVWIFLVLPVGLIVFLVIRLMTTRRGKTKFKKYRRPHYSYRIK